MADIDTHAPAHHAEMSELQHHFDDAEQQFESSTLGMWVFLLTELMFFGGMFGSYTVYRNMYPAAFASTSHFMNVTIGGINTAVLIFSSFTMVLAVRSAQLGQKKPLITFLVLTHRAGHRFPGVQVRRISRKMGGSSHSRSGIPLRRRRSISTRRRFCFSCTSR